MGFIDGGHSGKTAAMVDTEMKKGARFIEDLICLLDQLFTEIVI